MIATKNKADNLWYGFKTDNIGIRLLSDENGPIVTSIVSATEWNRYFDGDSEAQIKEQKKCGLDCVVEPFDEEYLEYLESDEGKHWFFEGKKIT